MPEYRQLSRTISFDKKSKEDTSPYLSRSFQSSPDFLKLKRNESMIGNLRNLFYNNQNASQIAGVPLDQKVMQKAKLHDDIISTQEPDFLGKTEDISLKSSTLKPRGVSLQRLTQTKQICTHNAKASLSVGQPGKADVWFLIAQIIDGMINSSYDDYDGWHGLGGGALGKELIASILTYYEAHGDIQMLATIVCVLTGGRDRRKTNDFYANSIFHQILPVNNEKYDGYIHLYGSLLYNWGQPTIRAEVNKHLAFTGSQNLQHDKYDFNSGLFAPLCPRCQRPANPETNICNICSEYAFRCSICTNAVRGLFTVCIECGHGGHGKNSSTMFKQ